MTIRKTVGHAVRRVLHQPIAAEILPRYKALPNTEHLPERGDAGFAQTFFAHRGRVVDKWVHYLDVYNRHFSQYCGTNVKMLEIGVFKGGSLELWREYFGASATIFGIDIEPACAGYVDPPNQVRIGSQDDPAFLDSVVREMGDPDIILDDGSHIARHQRASFEVLFPKLKHGGLYIIEDLHTAYWPGVFGGGYGYERTAIGLVKQMIDDMHAWYHNKRTKTPAQHEIGAIHIYDSIVVIEKRRKAMPRQIQVG